MIIHFICRGNAFRSIIAEAYLNSLELKDLSALSSGTGAALHKTRNLPYHRLTLELLEKHGIRGFVKAGYGDQLTQSRLDEAGIAICMNRRVYDECLPLVTFSVRPLVWSVADIGEPGRISDVESETQLYREEAYQEIVRNVECLVSDVLRANRLTPTVGNTGTPASANAGKHSPDIPRLRSVTEGCGRGIKISPDQGAPCAARADGRSVRG